MSSISRVTAPTAAHTIAGPVQALRSAGASPPTGPPPPARTPSAGPGAGPGRLTSGRPTGLGSSAAHPAFEAAATAGDPAPVAGTSPTSESETEAASANAA